MAISVPNINQLDYGKAYCLATCYLAMAKSFKYNIDMDTLKKAGIVSSLGYVESWGDYVARGESKTYNVTEIKAAIDAGKPCVVTGQSSDGTHYVVAYKYSGDTISVMEPYGGKTVAIDKSVLKSWSSYRACTKGSKK